MFNTEIEEGQKGPEKGVQKTVLVPVGAIGQAQGICLISLKG